MNEKDTADKERECEDCGNTVPENCGRPYKYEPDIWLCDDCHDERMEEDEEEYD